MDDLEKLRYICELTVKDSSLQPSNGKTFCNFAVRRICEYMGCYVFHDEMANEMIDIMARHVRFRVGDAKQAYYHAMSGGIAVAAHAYSLHGHVAAVYPVGMFTSPSWKKEVPFLANVGHKNGILPASECFPVADGEPEYYLYAG